MSDTRFDAEAEVALVASILAREPAAMEKLAQRLALIPRFLEAKNARCGRLLDSEELKDVEQDAQVAILRCLESYRPIAPMQAWIFGVCANHFRVAVRDKFKRRARCPSGASDEDVFDVPAPDPAIHEDWGGVESLLELVGGMEADIFRLKHLEELTFAEIGERLGIAANTAKTRYYRGLARLRWRVRAGEYPGQRDGRASRDTENGGDE